MLFKYRYKSAFYYVKGMHERDCRRSLEYKLKIDENRCVDTNTVYKPIPTGLIVPVGERKRIRKIYINLTKKEMIKNTKSSRPYGVDACRVAESRKLVKEFVREGFCEKYNQKILNLIHFNGTSNEIQFHINYIIYGGEPLPVNKRISLDYEYNKFETMLTEKITIEKPFQKLIRDLLKTDNLIPNTGFIVPYDDSIYYYPNIENTYQKIRNKLISQNVANCLYSPHVTLIEALDAAYLCKQDHLPA